MANTTTMESAFQSLLEKVGELNLNEGDFLTMNNLLKNAFDKNSDEEEDEEEDDRESVRINKSLYLIGTTTEQIAIASMYITTNNNDIFEWRNTEPGTNGFTEDWYIDFYDMLGRMCFKNNVHSVKYDEVEITLADLKVGCDRNSATFNLPKPESWSQMLKMFMNIRHTNRPA